MNIQLRLATKRDVFTYSEMSRAFRQEYKHTGKIAEIEGSFKNTVLADIQRGCCYMILMDSKIAGFCDLVQVFNSKTGKVDFSFIFNCFVKPQYRHQGVAAEARRQLLKSKKIRGSVVCFKRARQLVNYYLSLGYTTVRPYPEFEFGGEDHNLCIVANDNLPKDPMCLPLNEEHVLWSQQLAKELAEQQLAGRIPYLQNLKIP